ncbi:hypothetical protein K438DRAFT_1761945 [Mycena galopus ATCC 62051]|nr:hypothetical protein K438DRAFT_1761945 [Mycena galopus ATCC 62051]
MNHIIQTNSIGNSVSGSVDQVNSAFFRSNLDETDPHIGPVYGERSDISNFHRKSESDMVPEGMLVLDELRLEQEKHAAQQPHDYAKSEQHSWNIVKRRFPCCGTEQSSYVTQILLQWDLAAQLVGGEMQLPVEEVSKRLEQLRAAELDLQQKKEAHEQAKESTDKKNKKQKQNALSAYQQAVKKHKLAQQAFSDAENALAISPTSPEELQKKLEQVSEEAAKEAEDARMKDVRAKVNEARVAKKAEDACAKAAKDAEDVRTKADEAARAAKEAEDARMKDVRAKADEARVVKEAEDARAKAAKDAEDARTKADEAVRAVKEAEDARMKDVRVKADEARVAKEAEDARAKAMTSFIAVNYELHK